MSTPMETNTDQLRQILQQVYDLPEAGSGSSAEPDLVITPTEYFRFNPDNTTGNNRDFNVKKISFDPESVISTYEKLTAGKDVRVVLTGHIMLNSYSPPLMTTASAERALVYDETVNTAGKFLVVRFTVAHSYFFLSYDGDYACFEYRFWIKPTGEVVLDAAACWKSI